MAIGYCRRASSWYSTEYLFSQSETCSLMLSDIDTGICRMNEQANTPRDNSRLRENVACALVAG
jgi:hypothetical protein